MNPPRSDSFWVGNLAVAVVMASKEPDPRWILKATVKELQSDRPDLMAIVQSTLKEKR